MNAYKLVRQFRKKHKIKIVNSTSLNRALSEQGYTVIEFNGVTDNDDVRELTEALELTSELQSRRAFIYNNPKYRLVFLHKDLNEEEKIMALAHEEGHVWHEHLKTPEIFGNDVIQEYEASEFAHYLLLDKDGKKRKTKFLILAAVVAAAIIVVAGLLLKNNYDKAVYTDNLYRTESGTKYHVRDCMYLKDKTDVYRLTREEFDSGDYEPCDACLP